MEKYKGTIRLMKMVLFMLVFMFIAASCNSNGPDVIEQWDLSEAKLKVSTSTIITFDQEYARPINEKFPQITLEIVGNTANSVSISGANQGHSQTFYHYLVEDPGLMRINPEEPDLFIVPIGSLGPLIDAGHALDLTPYVSERNNLDLNRFDPQLLELIDAYGDGELYAIPYARAIPALYYNKKVFDHFNVEHPTDGITWEEVDVLAQKFKGDFGPLSYKGIRLDFGLMLSQLSVTLLDPTTDKLAVTLPDLKDGFVSTGSDRLDQVIQTYLNMLPNSASENDPDDLVAMFADRTFLRNHATDRDFHTTFGRISYPTFPSAPGTGPAPDGLVLIVNPKSEHIEETIAVINEMVSDEFQLAKAKSGFRPYGDGGTALKKADIQKYDAGGIFENAEPLTLTNIPRFDRISLYESSASYLIWNQFSSLNNRPPLE